MGKELRKPKVQIERMRFAKKDYETHTVSIEVTEELGQAEVLTC
jgi:hypothetical protein